MNVNELKMNLRDEVEVSFDDGYRARFVPYAHGMGYQIEGLRHFFLYQDQRPLCRYDSRLHYGGPNEDEHRFQMIAEGVSMETVVAYWRAVVSYLTSALRNMSFEQQMKTERGNELCFAQKVVSQGWNDLLELEKQISAT